MTGFVVVNPAAAGTQRAWPKIRPGLMSIFPLMQVVESQTRGHIAHLVREALQQGHLDIIVVGGDGSINEALNGFFEMGRKVSPDAVLGFLATGRNNFLARHLGDHNPGQSLRRLARSHIRKADVGHLACLSHQGQPMHRFFLGRSSFGFSATNGIFAAAAAWARWRPPHVRLIADHGTDEIDGITEVVVATAGGSAARTADGIFDITVLPGMRRLRLLRHLAHPAAGRIFQAGHLTAAATLETHGPVPVTCDGEPVGILPAAFSLLPSMVNLRC